MTMGIRVTPEQLDEMSARVAGGSGQIEGELRALASALLPLGTDWAGPAAIQFTDLWIDWQQAAQQLHDALSGIASLLGQAGASYVDAECQIANMFVMR